MKKKTKKSPIIIVQNIYPSNEVYKIPQCLSKAFINLPVATDAESGYWEKEQVVSDQSTSAGPCAWEPIANTMGASGNVGTKS